MEIFTRKCCWNRKNYYYNKLKKAIVLASFRKNEKNSKKFKKCIDNILKTQYTKSCRKTWSLSSAGRASALQAEGHRFEPYSDHHVLRPGSSVGQNASLSRQRSTVRARSRSPFFYAKILFASIAQLVEQGTENPRVTGSIPVRASINIQKENDYD